MISEATPGHGHGHGTFLLQGIPAVTSTCPSAEIRDGKQQPRLSLASLQADAQLTLCLLWQLAVHAELPRDYAPGPAEPTTAAGERTGSSSP